MSTLLGFYPLNRLEYQPFNKPLDDYIFGLTGHKGSGTSLIDNPKLRDHSIEVNDGELPEIKEKLDELLPKDGWYEIHYSE